MELFDDEAPAKPWSKKRAAVGELIGSSSKRPNLELP